MIYFDNSATTKPCDEALAAINDVLTNTWGNPSSSHSKGVEAHRIMEKARREVAQTVGMRRMTDGKVVFTSGGTEANNIAILGVVRSKERPMKNGRRGTVIISDGEHSSVESPAARLEAEGFKVLRIPTAGGRLDLEMLKKNVTGDVILASIMLVNNETGAIYDVKSASKIIKAASPDAVIHSDCVQAYMKMKFTLSDLGADMVSISAHKIFSCKGAGALVIAEPVIKAKKISPLVFGGGQEDGFRSGTESVPAIAGFGAAAALGYAKLAERIEQTRKLGEYAESAIAAVAGTRLNLPEKRLPNILNITVPNIKSETFLNFLSGEGICVSKSSACSTHSRALSSALLAFGLPESDVDSSLRISFSYLNTEDEIDTFCRMLEKGISSLSKIRK